MPELKKFYSSLNLFLKFFTYKLKNYLVSIQFSFFPNSCWYTFPMLYFRLLSIYKFEKGNEVI